MVVVDYRNALGISKCGITQHLGVLIDGRRCMTHGYAKLEICTVLHSLKHGIGYTTGGVVRIAETWKSMYILHPAYAASN